MKQSDFEQCVNGGLLRRIPPSPDKAKGSIEAAFRWLEEAETGLRSGTYNSSVLSSYLVMFHSARAILFKDGYREKSHFCIARYLEAKYASADLLEAKWIELLDYHRELRHNSQYDVSFFATAEDARNAIDTARQFLNRMVELSDKN